MKQILVDMDGVLADVYAQFQKFEKEETGNTIASDEIVGKTELEAFPNGSKHIQSEGFFRSAPTIPGSIKGLDYLNTHYKVWVVSSATQFPLSLHEKHQWLNEHYPFITWKQMIFCGEKKAVKGDIMIDDHPKNLDPFSGTKILFSQPHNVGTENHLYQRVFNWIELINYFKN